MITFLGKQRSFRVQESEPFRQLNSQGRTVPIEQVANAKDVFKMMQGAEKGQNRMWHFDSPKNRHSLDTYQYYMLRLHKILIPVPMENYRSSRSSSIHSCHLSKLEPIRLVSFAWMGSALLTRKFMRESLKTSILDRLNWIYVVGCCTNNMVISDPPASPKAMALEHFTYHFEAGQPGSVLFCCWAMRNPIAGNHGYLPSGCSNHDNLLSGECKSIKKSGTTFIPITAVKRANCG